MNLDNLQLPIGTDGLNLDLDALLGTNPSPPPVVEQTSPNVQATGSITDELKAELPSLADIGVAVPGVSLPGVAAGGDAAVSVGLPDLSAAPGLPPVGDSPAVATPAADKPKKSSTRSRAKAAPAEVPAETPTVNLQEEQYKAYTAAAYANVPMTRLELLIPSNLKLYGRILNVVGKLIEENA